MLKFVTSLKDNTLQTENGKLFSLHGFPNLSTSATFPSPVDIIFPIYQEKDKEKGKELFLFFGKLLLEREMEAKASMELVIGCDDAAMSLYGILHDGQSQSRSAHRTATSLVNPVEAFEDAFQVLGGHAGTVVGEGELPVVAHVAGFHPDGGAFAGIGDGIIDKVSEDAVEQGCISFDFDILGQAVFQGHVFVAQGYRCLLHDVGNQLRQVYGTYVKDVGGIVHAVKDGDVLQQRRKTLGLRMAAFDELPLGGSIEVGVVEQGLCKAED